MKQNHKYYSAFLFPLGHHISADHLNLSAIVYVFAIIAVNAALSHLCPTTNSVKPTALAPHRGFLA